MFASLLRTLRSAILFTLTHAVLQPQQQLIKRLREGFVFCSTDVINLYLCNKNQQNAHIFPLMI
jgi:hypothetical protein